MADEYRAASGPFALSRSTGSEQAWRNEVEGRFQLIRVSLYV